jgi:hypothetical protein
MVGENNVVKITKKKTTMVIAFLRWNPFHHKLREKWGDDPSIGCEYNGYVAFSEELPPTWQGSHSFDRDDVLDKIVDVHGGITYDSEMNTTYPMIPLTAIPDPEELKTFRCIGFDTLHCGDTRDKWPIERVKAETLKLMHQIENLIAERQ